MELNYKILTTAFLLLLMFFGFYMGALYATNNIYQKQKSSFYVYCSEQGCSCNWYGNADKLTLDFCSEYMKDKYSTK